MIPSRPTVLRQLAQKEIEAELKNVQQLADDDGRLPPNVEVFPVRLSEMRLILLNCRTDVSSLSLLLQTSESLRALLSTYSSQSSINAIDPSKWQIPNLTEDASEEEWVGVEKRSRVGLEHMGIRCVDMGTKWVTGEAY